MRFCAPPNSSDLPFWKRWSGYHQRSRLGSEMSCVKLLGEYLMAVTFDRSPQASDRATPLKRLIALGPLETGALHNAEGDADEPALKPICATEPEASVNYARSRRPSRSKAGPFSTVARCERPRIITSSSEPGPMSGRK